MDLQTLAANRFGLGARPGEIDSVGADPVGHLMQQLEASPRIFGPALPTSAEAITAFRQFRKQSRQMQAQKVDASLQTMKPANVGLQLYHAEVEARMQTFVRTATPFAERLCLFWANHFAVSAVTPPIASMVGAFEREAIRPHIAGNFADMLLACCQNPAMLIYLDNANSIGPNSISGQKRKKGLNENLAREVLELHTLGVDGGYSLEDLQQLAMAITGWSVAGPRFKRKVPGQFVFRRRAHEPGRRRVLGMDYRNTRSLAQGEHILQDLALHPSTARHLCRKLARYFISDRPDESLLASMEEAYSQSAGELVPVYQAMLHHPSAFDLQKGKIKQPVEFVISACRGLRIDRNLRFWARGMTVLGQRFWSPPSPKGWPDDSRLWMTSDGLKTRLDFAVAAARRVPAGRNVPKLAEAMLGSMLSSETAVAIDRAADQTQALALLLMSPEFQKR